MTREEFRDYVTQNGCTLQPIEGVNITGWSARIVNNRYNWAYYYMKMPIDETEMPDYQICHACEKLVIPSPPNVDCGEDEED